MNDILIIHRNGKFVRMNTENFGSIYGDPEFPGENLTIAYNADTASLLLKNIKKCLKSQTTVSYEYSVTDESMERRFEAAISPMAKDLALCVLRDITDLKAIQGKLEAKIVKLEEANTALNILIERMKESARNVEDTMLSNIRAFVLPHIKNLKKMRLSDVQMAYVELIETNLSKFTSPLIHDLRPYNLTPMELQVANLIKDGRTTRDIANLLHTSKVAIDNHRYNIRKKLGLNNKKENLRSFFLSIK